MKVLPLWQPWATLVAIGSKRVETRGWRAPQTIIGERVAIHATKGGLSRAEELELLESEPFFSHLRSIVPVEFMRPEDATPRAVLNALPRGGVIATAVVDRCIHITDERAAALEQRDPDEFAFGDYTPGRFAWVLRDVEQLPELVPFKASQGISEIDPELIGYPAETLFAV